MHFKRVFDGFNRTGIPCIGNQSGAPKKSKEHPKYVRIEEYFNENPKASIKDGARALKIPKSAVRGGLKKKFGLKWFLDRHGQELTNAMKAQRKKNLPMAFGTARRLPTSNNFWR